MSKSPRKSPTTSATANTANTANRAHPWIINGIDYGPAVAVIGELATWAFDLAAADVAEWPEGIRRVRNARRFVLSRIQGKRPRSAPMEDVLFSAGLLVRIFETDLTLGVSEMITILDQLGLPTEMVPVPCRQPSLCVALPAGGVTPLRPRTAPAATMVPGCFRHFQRAA